MTDRSPSFQYLEQHHGVTIIDARSEKMSQAFRMERMRNNGELSDLPEKQEGYYYIVSHICKILPNVKTHMPSLNC